MNQSLLTYLFGMLSALVFLSIGWWSAQPVHARPIGVSSGSNPLFSWAGQQSHSASSNIGNAPTTHDVVLTDVALTTSSFCGSHGYDVTLQTSSGAEIGKFRLSSAYANDSGHFVSNVSAHFRSGLVLPAGESLTLSNNGGYQDCKLNYTLSGYTAQP